eukprot:2858504-Amphidinium_carterae.1
MFHRCAKGSALQQTIAETEDKLTSLGFVTVVTFVDMGFGIRVSEVLLEDFTPFTVPLDVASASAVFCTMHAPLLLRMRTTSPTSTCVPCGCIAVNSIYKALHFQYERTTKLDKLTMSLDDKSFPHDRCGHCQRLYICAQQTLSRASRSTPLLPTQCAGCSPLHI